MSTVNWIIFGFGLFVASLLTAGLFLTVRFFRLSDRQSREKVSERS